MKLIQIRRHAEKNADGSLTEEGKKQAQVIKKSVPLFDLIISSDKPRAIETAKLLTGKEPIVDARAGTPPFSPEIMKELHMLGQKHEFGIAGVIFDNPQKREMIQIQGQKLAELIHETLQDLPENGQALIISHDGVMVAVEKILKHEQFNKAGKTFHPLQGFQINENGEIKNLTI